MRSDRVLGIVKEAGCKSVSYTPQKIDENNFLIFCGDLLATVFCTKDQAGETSCLSSLLTDHLGEPVTASTRSSFLNSNGTKTFKDLVYVGLSIYEEGDDSTKVFVMKRSEGSQAKFTLVKQFSVVYTHSDSVVPVGFQDILLKDSIDGSRGVDVFLVPRILAKTNFRVFRKTFPSISEIPSLTVVDINVGNPGDLTEVNSTNGISITTKDRNGEERKDGGVTIQTRYAPRGMFITTYNYETFVPGPQGNYV